MSRVSKKIITFTLAMVFFLGAGLPATNILALTNSETNYSIKEIIANEYDDAVRFGEGFILLKNGKFDNITSQTKYFYIDVNGNTKEIKNSIGFTEIYTSTSGNSYSGDDGVLTIGKNGKVALMDLNGVLYGGRNNFYSCAYYVGDELFYTSDQTKNIFDSQARWYLRKKDGTIIKEFDSLYMYQRQHYNGYEYIMYTENNVNNLIAVDKNGNITSFGEGYTSYYIEEGVLVAKKGNYDSPDMISVFTYDGNKMFDVENCTQINVEKLLNMGYAKVSFATPKDGEMVYYQNIVDTEGNLILESEKYDSTSGYDSDRILAVDKSENIQLIDYNKNVKFDAQKFAKTFGESYSAITLSAYYVDSTLAFTIKDEKNSNDPGQTFFFDKDGNQISGNIKGEVYYEFDGTNAVLFDSDLYKFRVVNKYAKQLGSYHDSINLTYLRGEVTDVIATVNGYSGPDGDLTIILKDGTEITDYNQIQFLNDKYIQVYKNGREGILDFSGNEIIQPGEYEHVFLSPQSEYITALKGGKIYLLSPNGNEINTGGKYSEIGSYETKFYKFDNGSEYGSENGSYINPINKHGLAITKNNINKFGIIKIINSNKTNFDVDGDGILTVKDVSLIALKYNKSRNELNWDEKLDLNKDGIIDIYDLILIAKEI